MPKVPNGYLCRYRNEKHCVYIACLGGICPGTGKCSLYESLRHKATYAAMPEDEKRAKLDYHNNYNKEHRDHIREMERRPEDKAKDQSRMGRPRNIVKAALYNHSRIGHKIEVTIDEALTIYMATDTCRYCGCELVPRQGGIKDTTPSIDRIDNGDVLTKDNIQYICQACNRTKGAHSHTEYMAYLRQMVAQE